MSAENDVNQLKAEFAEKITRSIEFRGEHTVVTTPDALHTVLGKCRHDLGYELLLDVCSVDHFGDDPRYEVVYELATLDDAKHLRVKVPVGEDGSVPSVADLWKAADWHEREVFDLMGIPFQNHPDLRRIIMWEGYPYHPLRKDFPLAGKPTEMPDVAFSAAAPLEGGPFVASSGETNTRHREPRARSVE